MLRHPSILGDPQRQARGAKKETWSQIKGNKIRSGRLTPTSSGSQKRVETLHHPCLLGGSKEGGNATSPLHSWVTFRMSAWA